MAKNEGKKNIASKVRDLICDTVEELGYILWDVEYVKEGADWFLRITLDSEEGISIDDCEKVHMAISPMLDEADPIEGSYRLEVSSPGVERELKNQMHYDACAGWPVRVRLFAAFEGRKVINAVFMGYDAENEQFVLNENGNELRIAKSLVSKINTVFDF